MSNQSRDTQGPESGDSTPTAEQEKANHHIHQYGEYVAKLRMYYPETFEKLGDFIERGNCACSSTTCKCTEVGFLCRCKYTNRKLAHPVEKCCCGDPKKPCATCKIEHRVRVYDVDANATTFSGFLRTDGFRESQSYNAGDKDEFEALKARLEVDDIGSSQARNDESHYRLITVSHLSSNVAKLLGGLYDIDIEFFNRHLPSTEAMSGRLLSRVQSALQIDFDELYESNETFRQIWGIPENMKKPLGHNIIREALGQYFLFQGLGWDYFPISDEDWFAGKRNTPMSSGFETRDDAVRNVFQFNLTHRVSIYSIPKNHRGHPKTAIIIFYPQLPICRIIKHYTRNKRGDFEHTELDGECEFVYFRGIPDTLPKMSELFHTSEGQTSNQEGATASLLGDNQPSHSGWAYGEALGEKLGTKWDYAKAFDKELRLHIEQHLKRRETQSQTSAEVDNGLIHIFGFPLLKIIAANWARLIQKTSLDLDLLEWRSKISDDQRTIKETKARRVAIVRHQRDISATLEVLRHLKHEERVMRFERELKKLEEPEVQSNPTQLEAVRARLLSDDDTTYNKGRSDGLFGTEEEEDSWESLYYDFFELQASIDALEKRSDKIQDYMLSMLNVQIQDSAMKSDQGAKRISFVIQLASVFVIPFSILGTIYSGAFGEKSLQESPLTIAPHSFWQKWGIIVAVLIVLMFMFPMHGVPECWEIVRDFRKNFKECRFRKGIDKEIKRDLANQRADTDNSGQGAAQDPRERHWRMRWNTSRRNGDAGLGV